MSRMLDEAIAGKTKVAATPTKPKYKKHKDPLAVEIGKRVIEGMQAVGLNRRQLAALVGMEYQTFSRSLAGWHRLPYEALLKLPATLCRTLNWLVGLPETGELGAEEQELVMIYRAQNSSLDRDLLMFWARCRYQEGMRQAQWIPQRDRPKSTQ